MVAVGWVFWGGVVSCLMSSGVLGALIMGMCGHVSAKHRGCHESPWLLVFRTRHSRPWKSQLHMLQVALVCGIRLGCMVVYVFVGSAIDRLRRFAGP